MNKHTILFAEQDNTWFIRLVGEIRYPVGLEIRSLTSRLYTQKHIQHVVIDLNQTMYIDSTNLGLLARLGQTLLKLRSNKLTMLSSRHDINVFLDSMGFTHVAIIIHNTKHLVAEFKDMPEIPISDKERLNTLIDAHQSLIDMDQHNKPKFKDLVALLKKSSHSSKSRPLSTH